jgi:ABC-type transport system involved in multi-copper enzyme maturation permease subunit
MTTTTLPRLGPAWVTWRQHRVALIGLLCLLAGIGAVLLFSGLRMYAAYDAFGLDRCHGFDGGTCERLSEAFYARYRGWDTLSMLMFLPGLVGAFIGAPIIARELESGTFRFAWTQGCGRTRWAVTKLTLLTVVVTVAALSFSVAFAWWHGPLTRIGGRMDPATSYEVEGVVFAARTLFAIPLGAFLGAVIRRTVPAMATTLAIWIAVVVTTMLLIRPHLARPITAPLRSATHGVHNEWLLRTWWVDPNGHRLSGAQSDALITSLEHHDQNAVTWLDAHHYTSWSTYLPSSRFWTLQLLESGGLTVLALLFAVATVWWVRHRAT